MLLGYRYKRIYDGLLRAGFCDTEAGCILRSTKRGQAWSCEAADVMGGNAAAIKAARRAYRAFGPVNRTHCRTAGETIALSAYR